MSDEKDDSNIIDIEAPYGRKKDGTPRKPAGFQKGGAQYRAPSHSSDGKNLPGGQIWGASSGESRGWTGKNPTKETMHPVMSASHAEKMERAERNRLSKEAKTAILEDFFLDVVFEKRDGEEDAPIMAKLHAAGKLHEIYNGKPTVRLAGGGPGEEPIQVAAETLDGRRMTPDQRDVLRQILIAAKEK